MTWLADDKNLVIILGVSIIFSGPMEQEKATIINSLFSGLFGIAVGRATK